MLSNKNKNSKFTPKLIDSEVNNGDDFNCLMLKPDSAYTIGRSNEYADIIFNDPYISKRHCQILFDSSNQRLYILNGVLLFDSNCDRGIDCVVDQFRVRNGVNVEGFCDCKYEFKAGLNGVFVNRVRVCVGKVVELCVGDVVTLVCGGRGGVCEGGARVVGFVVRKVEVVEGVVELGFEFDRVEIDRRRLVGSKRVFALRISDDDDKINECGYSRLDVFGRAKFLKGLCSEILGSDDPVGCIRRCVCSCYSRIGVCNCIGKAISGSISKTKAPTRSLSNVGVVNQGAFEKSVGLLGGTVVQSISNDSGFGEKTIHSLPKSRTLYPIECVGVGVSSIDNNKKIKYSKPISANRNIRFSCEPISQNGCQGKLPPSPGKNFYLNALKSVHKSSVGGDKVVSLPELLHPVDSITRMFIATFTSDIECYYCVP